ncbi:serine hydrolase domain-containing protein [Mangrovactinospora gilvigrisea]|uniref:serine hydrolase n=1 Tax=Mangrovactinospora gilvigrisea TaxID=1428644 RepID=UPI0008FCB660
MTEHAGGVSAAERMGEALQAVVDGGGTPGGVLAYGMVDEEPWFTACGRVAPADPDSIRPGPDTRYDLASLTKVVATWPLVGAAVTGGLMEVDKLVRDYLPPMASDAPGGAATVRQLLSHTAGLCASTRLDRYRDAALPLHERPHDPSSGPRRRCACPGGACAMRRAARRRPSGPAGPAPGGGCPATAAWPGPRCRRRTLD